MPSSSAKTRNRLLWTAQVVVALMFAFAGSMKFIMPAEKMQQGPMALPIAFIHYIGVCECLGAIALIVPGVLRFQTWLTPLAAIGLTIIMIGATVLTVPTMGVAPAILPAILGILTVTIARGRMTVAPLADRGRHAHGRVLPAT